MKQTSKKLIEEILKKHSQLKTNKTMLRIDLEMLVLIAQREQLIEDRDANLKIIEKI